MIHQSDGQTDRQTDGRAIAYMRYSIYAVARNKKPFHNSICKACKNYCF